MERTREWLRSRRRRENGPLQDRRPSRGDWCLELGHAGPCALRCWVCAPRLNCRCYRGDIMMDEDTTGGSRLSDAMREHRLDAEAILRTMRQPLVVLNGDLRSRRRTALSTRPSRSARRNRGTAALRPRQRPWDIPDCGVCSRTSCRTSARSPTTGSSTISSEIGRRVMLLNATGWSATATTT